MSINALYVYSPTTFTTDMQIEPMAGEPIAAGEITLDPGIYRLPADAELVAQTAARGPSYTIVALGDTKGGYPDPPLQAVERYGMDQIQNFLGGAGEENAI